MSRETFVYICGQLRSRIQRVNTRMRQAISVKKRLAVALWCLATPAEYRTIGYLFGIARSTACRIVHETCNAIVEVLLRKYIHFPAGDRLQQILQGFENKWGVPQCVGAVVFQYPLQKCVTPIITIAKDGTLLLSRQLLIMIICLRRLGRQRSQRSCFCTFYSI